MNQSSAVTYDKYGRMNYSPELHANHGKPWITTDEKYLIENYAIDGPEQTSLALGRTIHTVMTRAYELRKMGRMHKPEIRIIHSRTSSSVATL